MRNGEREEEWVQINITSMVNCDAVSAGVPTTGIADVRRESATISKDVMVCQATV